MPKKKVLVWETLATVSGGQKMTLLVMDLLKDTCDFFCLIPEKGKLSDELDKRNIPYALMGDQTMPTGVKGKQVIFRYGWLSVKNTVRSLLKIASYRPDLLYAPGPAALPWSAVCGMMTGKPVIWHLHHVFLDGATKKLLNICAKWKCVRRIIAVSCCVGEQIGGAAAKEKLTVLYNPVDADKYSKGDAKAFRNTLGNAFDHAEEKADTNKVVIGHVALLQRSKRQDFVLDVMANLKGQGYEVEGFFPGEVREMDYVHELEEKAYELGLIDYTHFLGRRSDIPDILKALDVLMIPSAFEGFPLAGLEAAAAGIPVVACDVAGAAEFVDVSKAGLSYTEQDVEKAAECVMSALDQRDKLIANGAEFVNRCSVDSFKHELEKLFV